MVQTVDCRDAMHCVSTKTENNIIHKLHKNKIQQKEPLNDRHSALDAGSPCIIAYVRDTATSAV